MALEKLKKTDYNGAKHSRGAWTSKYDAKVSSRKRRRENWKKERNSILTGLTKPSDTSV